MSARSASGARLGLLFPGQGSQVVGMGRDLHDAHPEARGTWEEAARILGIDLAAIAFGGPDEELRKTHNTQPALFVASLATLAVLRARGVAGASRISGDCDADGAGVVVAAGHSLGEYTALVAAGALRFEDGLKLVRRRGELMWRSGVERPGTMAAVLGMTIAEVEDVCSSAADAGTVCAANHNAPRQVVISGDVAAVERAMALAKERGAKRALRLEVSGAFHSPLMEPAAQGLRESLAATSFSRASFPVVANVDAVAKAEPGEIADALARQLTSAVRWVATMESMCADRGAKAPDLFLEIGPGKVLAGLARQIAPAARVVNVENCESLEAALEAVRSLEAAGGRT